MAARASFAWMGRPLWVEKDRVYFQAAKNGNDIFAVGDCVILRPSSAKEKPYVGRIEALFERHHTKFLITCWFFHPEEVSSGRRSQDGKNELYISPQRAENELTAVMSKCHVLSYEQFVQGVYPRHEPVYFVRKIYDPDAETQSDLVLYKSIAPSVNPRDGYEIEQVVGRMIDAESEMYYLVKWEGLDNTHNSWVPARSVSSPPEFTGNPTVVRFARSSGSSAFPPRVQIRSDRWDISNIVGFPEQSVTYIPQEKAEKIEIPTWRPVVDEPASRSILLPPERGSLRSQREESSSEETSDDYYSALHNEQNEKLIVIVDRARKEAERVRAETQRRRDALESSIHYDRVRY